VALDPDGERCLDLAPADAERASGTEPDVDPHGDAHERAPP
jgi:hypothetical protein